MKRIRERLRVEMKALRGASASAVVRTINPIVRGWSAYYTSRAEAMRSASTHSRPATTDLGSSTSSGMSAEVSK